MENNELILFAITATVMGVVLWRCINSHFREIEKEYEQEHKARMEFYELIEEYFKLK